MQVNRDALFYFNTLHVSVHYILKRTLTANKKQQCSLTCQHPRIMGIEQTKVPIKIS